VARVDELEGDTLRSATLVKCMTADAGFVIRSRGPKCGKFTIDGNSIATQPFYTDGVDRNFEDIDIRNSAGDGVIFENAQNCNVVGLGINESAVNALTFRNGASTNKIDLLRISGFNGYGVKQHQTVAQGAAYPNGLSGTILAQAPVNNKLYAPIIERLGSTVGGGTVGVGLGGVYCRGGSLYMHKPNFACPGNTADTPTLDMEWDGISTANRLEIEHVTALGDTTFGIFARIKADAFASRLVLREPRLQAYRCAYRISDVGAVDVKATSAAYSVVTNLFENEGGGTKTYDNLVRSSRMEPIDWTRPATGDHIWTTKRAADAGYRAAVTADGVLYQGDGTSGTVTT
jgi:hypothetical protein